jgi:hypothetical protein
VTLLQWLRRARLRLRDRSNRQDSRDGQSCYSIDTHPASKVLARTIALPLWETFPMPQC